MERTRCLELIDRVVSRDVNSDWPGSANFGEMRGKDWSKLHYIHLDHHLRQFSA